MENSIVAIGDIHGCVRSLEALWEKLEPYRHLRHVFIGDYIDRGPASRQVVDFLMRVRHERDCIFLRGNHEQMLLDALEQGNTVNWLYNGGESTLNSYGNPQSLSDLPPDHVDFYKETRLYYETNNYFFVHAGAPPHQTLAKSKESPKSRHFFLWGREHLNSFNPAWEKTVIFGHTPRPHPIRKVKMLGIDTGCVYNELGYGKLTAVVLPENTFIQQSSLDQNE